MTKDDNNHDQMIGPGTDLVLSLCGLLILMLLLLLPQLTMSNKVVDALAVQVESYVRENVELTSGVKKLQNNSDNINKIKTEKKELDDLLKTLQSDLLSEKSLWESEKEQLSGELLAKNEELKQLQRTLEDKETLIGNLAKFFKDTRKKLADSQTQLESQSETDKTVERHIDNVLQFLGRNFTPIDVNADTPDTLVEKMLSIVVTIKRITPNLLKLKNISDQFDLNNKNLVDLEQRLLLLEKIETAYIREGLDTNDISDLLLDSVSVLGLKSIFYEQIYIAFKNNPEFKIEDDRFILPATVLFDSGEAKLKNSGMRELDRIASSMNLINDTLHRDLDWVLRVDGHADIDKVTQGYTDNWELSAERSLSVVRYLINQGVPPSRLIASGLGEFRPYRSNPDLKKQSRRIEFRLTQF